MIITPGSEVHSGVEVFEDVPVVGLDQCVRHLMQPVVAQARHTVVVPPQLGGGLGPVGRSSPRSLIFFVKRGWPTFLPDPVPLRELVQAPSARLRSTAASSKTWFSTSERQGRPVTSTSAAPSLLMSTRRPASSLFFHALIRSNPDHGTEEPA